MLCACPSKDPGSCDLSVSGVGWVFVGLCRERVGGGWGSWCGRSRACGGSWAEQWEKEGHVVPRLIKNKSDQDPEQFYRGLLIVP